MVLITSENSTLIKIMGHQPLIRWAGSKTKLIPELIASAPCKFERYYEPFFGSGCLFFELKPKKATLGDFNAELISFYKRTRRKPEIILETAKQFPRTIKSYYAIREQYKTECDADMRASMFLYLNRFCFNGIYRTNLAGHFNVPLGYRTGDFPKHESFITSAKMLRPCAMINADFENTLSCVKAGDFVYLDPPYAYSEHRDRGEYGKGSFKIADIKRLQCILHELDTKGAMFLLSYVECEDISLLSRLRRVKQLPVKRCVAGLASSRVSVNELLISNY